MDNCKESSTPMATNCYLGTDETSKSVDQTMYRDMIGSLLYLTNRPNIMHSVCMCKISIMFKIIKSNWCKKDNKISKSNKDTKFMVSHGCKYITYMI